MVTSQEVLREGLMRMRHFSKILQKVREWALLLGLSGESSERSGERAKARRQQELEGGLSKHQEGQ